MFGNILTPALVLVLWSIFMLMWMTAVRLPAVAKSDRKREMKRVGGRGVDLDGILPDRVNWKAHNFTNLMEQPTLFYAVVLALFVMEASTTLTLGLAWAYVILRVLHSIWQATVNTIFPVRISLYTASSLCLLAMAVLALIETLN